MSSEGLTISIVTGPGNEHDSQQFEQVLEGIRINIGRGRPRTRPVEAVADAGYDLDAIRAYLRRRDIMSNMPANKRNHKRSSPVDLRGSIQRPTKCGRLLSGSSDG